MFTAQMFTTQSPDSVLCRINYKVMSYIFIQRQLKFPIC